MNRLYPILSVSVIFAGVAFGFAQLPDDPAPGVPGNPRLLTKATIQTNPTGAARVSLPMNIGVLATSVDTKPGVSPGSPARQGLPPLKSATPTTHQASPVAPIRDHALPLRGPTLRK